MSNQQCESTDTDSNATRYVMIVTARNPTLGIGNVEWPIWNIVVFSWSNSDHLQWSYGQRTIVAF